jgi:hypothetical protein
MGDQAPHGLVGFNIFLPANMTVAAVHLGTAIQAILLFSFFGVRHETTMISPGKVLQITQPFSGNN